MVDRLTSDRKYYVANRERIRAYQRAYNQSHQSDFRRRAREFVQRERQKVIDFLGGRCIRCGFIDIRALQADHVNGGGSKDRRGKRTSYKEVVDNPGKYQLLCANCNWIKRVENGEVRRG